MGCSPSHALIINSSRTHEPVCLQPRIYMVSESTLRILQDVGELRLYQQEDKDPGVARVRFGTTTLDQLENPVGYQSQIQRQFSVDSEQGIKLSQNDSKIAAPVVNQETAQENNHNSMEEDSVDFNEEEVNESSRLLRDDTTSQCSNSSSSTLITAQIHNPLSLKNLAKESVPNDADSTTESPDSRTNLTVVYNRSSYSSLQ